MAQNLFSVFIFFIVFRETLEASIVISILLGLVDQVVHNEPERVAGVEVIRMVAINQSSSLSTVDGSPSDASATASAQPDMGRRRLIRILKYQILLGGGMGFLIALALGAAFIGVWFTEASNLWEKSENVLQGVFQLIASIMIFVMGITLLKMDRGKATWRVKLQRSINNERRGRGAKTAKWALFVLPLVTVVREGIEAVVFVGGVSFSQTATSIPIAAIVGLICGLMCGFLIYQFASRTTLSLVLIITTNLILLIGAGLFSKAVESFQENAFDRLVGADPDVNGVGPGTYDVRGSVWALDCCNPDTRGWSIFNAVLGWQNNATQGSVLSYVFYWLAVITTLVYMKYNEGRTKIFGRESATGAHRRRLRLAKSEPARLPRLDAEVGAVASANS